jgi:hypothetical protein
MAMMAQAHQLSISARANQQLRAGQIVIEHDLGSSQTFGPAECQQTWIARSGADQVHFADNGAHETKNLIAAAISTVQSIPKSRIHLMLR